MNKILGHYENGNYQVSIFDDGTKIRKNNLDFFSPKFPENIDLKITDYCDAGCAFCHEDSTRKGLHGDLFVPFIETLRPYTELAIGGGNPLDHPQLKPFLRYLKSKNIIANLTINQIHLEKRNDFIQKLVDEELVYGLGFSMIKPTDKFIALVQNYKHSIIHTINGITTLEMYEKLANKNLKILILGYKYLRRGVNYYSDIVENNKNELKDNIEKISKWFPIVSFDNLALEQLEMKSKLKSEYWNKFYMGDDGNFTMYVDLINKQFAKSSTSLDRYSVSDNIDDMFKIILENKKVKNE